ncbi:MAG: fimbrial protein [Ralstonia sp.]|uniref:fimbrial protein n=1 Tax=Ralstonia sp. TaxID=54061 RepID=UPI003F8009B4
MKAKLFLAGVAMSALSSVAMAADPVDPPVVKETVDGVINFQGTILNDTCKVSSTTGDAGAINVSMGNIAADDIGTLAAPKRLTNGAGAANFDVVCKKGAKVSMKFAGKVAELSADKKTLRVNNGNTSAGFAQGVGIAVYEGTGSSANAFDLSNGDLLAQTEVPEGGGSLNVRFAAAYVADDATKVKPGIANASLPFTLSYE